MNTKKYKQGLVTSLTALSTAMLCQTATTYASDIEIYKAPTTGGASIMFVLDLSGSMSQDHYDAVNRDFFNNASCEKEGYSVSANLGTVPYSFNGQYCFIKETQTSRVQTSTTTEYKLVQRRDGWGGWYNESYLPTSTPATTSTENLSPINNAQFSTLSSANQNKIRASCLIGSVNNISDSSPTETLKEKGSVFDETSTGSGWNQIRRRSQLYTVVTSTTRSTEAGNKYSCPDRVTMLKRSLFDLIAGNSTVDGQTATTQRLADTASIGLTTFYNSSPSVITNPLVLNAANRATLLNYIKQWSAVGGTPISWAYAKAAEGLINHIGGVGASEKACAGYGLYYLTDGEPSVDKMTSTRTIINAKLVSGSRISDTQCDGDTGGNGATNNEKVWSCVKPIAQLLQNKKSTSGVEIKTAIVGFGSDFSFKNSSGEAVVYNKNLTADQAAALFTSVYQKEAARTAVLGQGGWFSADNTSDIRDSVTNFVDSVKVPIPAITTGTSAIPQDVLNTSVIQPYAYFPQFQPKPSEEFRAWTGNLKKYNVADGLLKDKTNTALFSSAGVLNTANEDLWTPNYSASTTLTDDQQRIKLLGGLLSRLNLKKTDATLNRKVFTSDGTTLTAINEDYIKADPTNRGYYLGLLGYDITATQVQRLTSSFDLSQLPQTTSELRQIGAVMHSTPVLLTQAGKVSYVAAQAAQAATTTTAAVAARDAYMDTTNRDDYILFGTTQGVLHVVKAGKSDEITTVGNTAGQEVFAFVPQEMLAAQGNAFLDPPQTVSTTETSTNGMNNLYYGVDGAWTAHTEYVYNSTADQFKVYDTSSKYGKQWVYGGLRMGGRSYYALDLTKMAEATDNQPRIKFRINPVTSSVDGFATPLSTAESARYANLAKMGQSWSKPTIANVQWKGKRRLVMLVGGGYDPGYETFNYDQDAVTQNTGTGRGQGIGAGVYMFDANTGELLWSTYDAVDSTKPSTAPYIGDGNELKYSVVSQIKGVDRDGDGDVDHLYFGDLGGQVFRIDLNSAHNASTGTAANYAKQITRIYNGHVAGGVSPRFYEMPAFTVYAGTGGTFAVISIGSGNRSTPLLGKKVNTAYIVNGETDALNATFINDGIYNIYDKGVVASTPPEPGTSPTIDALHQLTDTNRISAATLATWREVATVVGTGSTAVNHAAKSGWYYPFTSSENVGGRKAVEKVQGDLIAIDNDLYVSTFDAEGVGSTEACGAGIYGNSRAHRFCMPYGQCAGTDTVANNTLVLGKGLLGITIGPGTSGADRRIIAPLGSLTSGNKITDIVYGATNKLIPQSWYEKN
ncbi:hypothetical protein [Acinetobacter sp.]|uniref:hypothetical protein n=1 Tax=Acinetobacter sp. TaxID=472 RepID=UPI0035B12C82